MKSVTSGIIKEGDILIIEGGVAKHIINPKKRGEKVTGAYATVINDDLLPSTVFVDAKDVCEDDIKDIESIARQKAIDTSMYPLSSQKNIRKESKKKNCCNAAKTLVEVVKVANPQIEGDRQIVIANVKGDKGNYNVMATGKHAERLIVLEGQKACLNLAVKADGTAVFNTRYKAYEAVEVHFSCKKAIVETVVTKREGCYYIQGKDGQDICLDVHDLETIVLLERSICKKVKLVLEYMGENKDKFIVTDVVSLEEEMADKEVSLCASPAEKQ